MKKLFFLASHKTASRWILHNSIDLAKCLLMRLDSSWGKTVEAGTKLNFDEKSILTINNANLDKLINTIGREHLDECIFYYITRDFRDQVVSGYFSHRYNHAKSNKRIANHIDNLKELNKYDGLTEEIKYFKHRAKNLNSFLDDKGKRLNLNIIDFDDITNSTFDTYSKILTSFGINLEENKSNAKARYYIFSAFYKFNKGLSYYSPRNELSSNLLRYIIEKNSFEAKKKSEKKKKEVRVGHYRKGKTGDWRNHFKPEHCELFDELYGDLLIRYGYEDDKNWIY